MSQYPSSEILHLFSRNQDPDAGRFRETSLRISLFWDFKNDNRSLESISATALLTLSLNNQFYQQVLIKNVQ